MITHLEAVAEDWLRAFGLDEDEIPKEARSLARHMEENGSCSDWTWVRRGEETKERGPSKLAIIRGALERLLERGKSTRWTSLLRLAGAVADDLRLAGHSGFGVETVRKALATIRDEGYWHYRGEGEWQWNPRGNVDPAVADVVRSELLRLLTAFPGKLWASDRKLAEDLAERMRMAGHEGCGSEYARKMLARIRDSGFEHYHVGQGWICQKAQV